MHACMPDRVLVLFLGDDDEAEVGPCMIRVAFRLAMNNSDPTPELGYHLIETMPKALAESCVAQTLAELPKTVLAEALVLDDQPALPVISPSMDVQDLTAWALNPSQLQAVQHALSMPLMVTQFVSWHSSIGCTPTSAVSLRSTFILAVSDTILPCLHNHRASLSTQALELSPCHS